MSGQLNVFDCYLVTGSIIMGRGGGYKTGGGGTLSFTPSKRGGGGKSFIHAEGGAQKVLGYFLRASLKF